MWFKKNDDEQWERIDALRMQMRSELNIEISKIRSEMNEWVKELAKENDKNRVEIEARLAPMPKDYAERIAELEVKMAKLWAVLTKVSNTGQEGPSRTARVMFGGKARQ